MTPDEIVACAQRLYQRAAFADNAIYYQNDQKAYQHARAAFHEAAKLLDFCAPKTCGTCADWSDSNSGIDGNGDEWRFCVSDTSLCNDPDYDSLAWRADHGCPQWRAKNNA